MKHVEIFRAEGVPQEMTISIRHVLPKHKDIATARALYASEGTALAEAIWLACPGGTVDALITALLARKASLFRMPFPRDTLLVRDGESGA